MAALNYSGLLLASKGDYDEDKYDEDDDGDNEQAIDKRGSYLYFKPLNEWKVKKDWHHKMQYGESIQCIAQGSGWCAAYTDAGFVRVFSQDGVQSQVFH